MDKQVITGNGGQNYTLTHAVANAQEIEVFVNNVRQEAGVAYTVSGTALTMTGNVASADDFYVIYQGKALQTVVPPDGSVTSAKLDTNLNVTGQLTQGGKEYFHVDLTTEQGSITDNTVVVIDFGGSGTVKYDTKSNVDTSNDAYLLDSSDGVYLISFSAGIRSEDPLSTERLIDAAVFAEVATDGSTFAALHGSGASVHDSGSDEMGSITLNGSFIYKATTATTKIRLSAYANTVGSGTITWTIGADANDMIQGNPSASTNSRCTFLSVVRIA